MLGKLISVTYAFWFAVDELLDAIYGRGGLKIQKSRKFVFNE